jgi:hypothetical protein
VSKEDIGPAPAQIPRKRKALDEAPAKWIAEWIERDDTPPGLRKKLEAVRASRKQQSSYTIVGYVGTDAGMTPDQQESVYTCLMRLAPDKAVYVLNDAGNRFVRVARKLMSRRDNRQGAIELDPLPPVTVDDAMHRQVVREVDVLIVAPKSPDLVSDQVIDAVRFARDRGVPMHIFSPTGERLSFVEGKVTAER